MHSDRSVNVASVTEAVSALKGMFNDFTVQNQNALYEPEILDLATRQQTGLLQGPMTTENKPSLMEHIQTVLRNCENITVIRNQKRRTG